MPKIKFYTQFVLDDLNISRRKDIDPYYQKGFIQNKYGYQIGTKFENKNLHVNIEYNQVQPYTYGHRSIIRNYTHMNQSLAHPPEIKSLVLVPLEVQHRCFPVIKF